MLAAGLDGLDRGCELGPPLEEIEHGFGGSAHSVTKPLPASLGEALDALEEDDLIVAALGSELMDLFRSAKGLEWEAYRRQVTPGSGRRTSSAAETAARIAPDQRKPDPRYSTEVGSSPVAKPSRRYSARFDRDRSGFIEGEAAGAR